MEERLSQRIVGHAIPEYMIEVLIQDYAGTFLRMVVSRNGGVYDLSYELNGYRRCMAQRLPSCARHGTSLTGESPVTGIYRQV